MNRAGWAVGTPLVYRRYREEGVTLRHRPHGDGTPSLPVSIGHWCEAWTVHVVADQLANGQRIRALTVVEVCTRESLAIEVGHRLRSEHVVQVLNRFTAYRGAPKRVCCDTGSECCSQLVDLWADQHRVQIDCSRPGKPTDNASVESFNATLRRECLNAH